ncbi:MAG: site-specific integrase, partial [Ruminococcus sp.]|nr:site-specific integrase [Ruminococcus sp.]
MNSYNNSNNPEFLNNYLMHLKIVKLLSERTIEEYYLDIRLFLRYVHGTGEKDVTEVNISDMTEAELKKITVSDIYNFIFFTADDRNNAERSRYRKISALRSFFKYLEKVANIIEKDPTKDLDVRTPKAARPKFLSLKESLRLLEASDKSDSKRDYCIITIFLNCGIRLSELVGININDIDLFECRMTVLGKGNKQ